MANKFDRSETGNRDITPEFQTIGGVFEKSHVFQVPPYQRSYAWESEQIEDFIKDLECSVTLRQSGSPKHHFIGGIVCVDHHKTGDGIIYAEVIDGQQRLATISILASQIILELNLLQEKCSGELEEFIKEFTDELNEKYIFQKVRRGTSHDKLKKLTLSKADTDFFIKCIKGEEAASNRESHQRIKYAFKKLRGFLKTNIDPIRTNKKKVEWLSTLSMVLDNDWTTVAMYTKDLSTAYMMFQVLNDRGISLSDGDLLRAFTLEFSEGSKHQATIEKIWDDILRRPPSDIDNYLRWIYTSLVGQRPSPTNLFDNFKEKVMGLNSSSKATTAAINKVLTITKSLQIDFDLLDQLVAGKWPFLKKSLKVKAWDKERLRLLSTELKHTNCMPLLLAATNLSESDFSKIVQSVERFAFRYKIIGNAHISAASRVYNETAGAIRKSPKSYSHGKFVGSLNKLINERVPDATFEALLKELKYKDNGSNTILRYFIITLSDYYKWYLSKKSKHPTCQDKSKVFDFNATTIEHIYPQNAKQTIAKSEAVKNDIGNLIVLSQRDNGAAGNKVFSQKKKILSKSDVLINREVAKHSSWNSTKIIARSDLVAQIASDIFKA